MEQQNNKEMLFKLTKQAFLNAYSPYSNYNVGAVVLTKDNKAFIGANVENASFPASVCAETICIASAYSNGYRKNDIAAFALISGSKKPSMPCGSCRQVMAELIPAETPIYVFNIEGDCVETNMKTLLPYPFSDEDLHNV